ncbi:MAG: helix-turn-helix domain-containing protein [Prevotella sp.]|nr:helix-turn-helix domain-containing protein [Prevotella sp.]
MKKLILLIILCVYCDFGYSKIRSYNNLIVQHYTEEEGLSNNIVYCSLKTHDGFLWFGTWYGLCRFDGLNFKTYTNSFTLASDPSPGKVETVVEDKQGNIWIKTIDWKLSVFFKKTERFESVFDELKPFTHNIQIIKIQRSNDGGVLLLTKDKNLLYAYTTQSGKIIIRRVASSRGLINSFNDRLRYSYVEVCGNRASWVGTDYSIFSVRLNRQSCRSKAYWMRYFSKKNKESNQFRDQYGCIWTNGKNALTYYNPKTGTKKDFPFTLYGKITEPCFCDAGEHGLFFLTAAGEAMYIDRKKLTSQNLALLYQMQDQQPNSRYLSMQIDRDGILWLTSTNNGVFSISFPRKQFQFLSLPLKDNDAVRAIYQLPNGDVWVGTKSKDLFVLDSNKKLKFDYSYARYHIGSVYNIMADDSGNYWLSTKGDGLVRAVPDAKCYGGYRFEHYQHDVHNSKSISGNKVYITYQDHYGRIWVGTLDGGLDLIVDHHGQLEFKNKYNGMAGYPRYGLYMGVRNMVEDKNGRMWVGTMDGLMSFSTRFRSVSDIKFVTYRNTVTNVLANADVYELYKDHSQNIWICTFGGGLSRIVRLDENTGLPLLKSLGTKDGLQDNVIFSIVEDNWDRLWLSHDNGISCYNQVTGKVLNFDICDGFPDVSMDDASASLLNQNGEIWVGCRKGLIIFRPNLLKSSVKKSAVYIIGCEVNNRDIRSYIDHPILKQSITYAHHLVLKYNQNMFTLEFAALDFLREKRVTYRYRLNGYDHNWHYTGHHRIASYTNVPPGYYTFQVESMDASNLNLTNSRTLQIRILPPWWATWWAYLIYGILFLVLLYFALHYIRYQIRMHNDVYVRSKIAEFKMNFYLKQKDIEFINKVNQIIADHLSDEDFEIEKIAQQIGMSRSAFFKKIKMLTGLSPIDCVKEYKLNHAVELLKSTSLSITDVAFQSGFSDVGYFGKCFRKKFGMSPRDYKGS